uniref:Telomerase reverse transcriptase n=1 Tax=Latimeria chalumnae TaxID=7897 RepID=H3ADV1_LATCH
LLSVLKSIYFKVFSFEDFFRTIDVSEKPAVLQAEDDHMYKAFISNLVVCQVQNIKPLPKPLTFVQISEQEEVVARILQSINARGRKNINVLNFGYGSLGEGHVPLRYTNSVCSYNLNSITPTVSTSHVWKTLLSRIGDVLMMYLLQQCSLFMLVPPSCCYQVSGVPVYSLLSSNVDYSSFWVKHRLTKLKRNILFKCVQKKFQFYRKVLAKADKWRQQRNSRMGTLRNESGAVSKAKAPVHQRTRAKQMVKIDLVTRQQDDVFGASQSTAIARSAQTKRHNEDNTGAPAKKFRGTLTYDEDITPSSSMSSNEGTPCEKGSEQHMNCDRCAKLNIEGKALLVCNANQTVKMDPVIRQEEESENDNHTTPNVLGAVLFTTKSGQTKRQNENQNGAPAKKFVGALIQVENAHSSSSACSKIPVTKNIQGTVSNDGEVGHSEKGSRQQNYSNKGTKASKSKPSVAYTAKVSIMYSSRYYSGFPRSFILNRLKGCKSDGQRLVETIFLNKLTFSKIGTEKQPNSSWKKKRLPKRYWQMRHSFLELLQNHRRCSYFALLNATCPVFFLRACRGKRDCAQIESHPIGGQPLSTPVAEMTKFTQIVDQPVEAAANEREKESDGCDLNVKELINKHSSYLQVYRFVRGCLVKVVPEQLWGSNHNKRHYLKNIKKFISVGKYDRLTLQELMWKMRVNDCVWLRLNKGQCCVPTSEHHLREEILAKFLYWLLNTYVVELLRSFFYATEMLFQKNKVFFYRKLIWHKLDEIGLGMHLKKLQLLSIQEVEALQKKKNAPFASRFRFIPKRNGLRPVVKMGATPGLKTYSKKDSERKAEYFNAQVKVLFSVLNYERTRDPSLLGSSVFGLDDTYKVWKQFMMMRRTTVENSSPLYFVKTDVTGAYDNIPHKKLKEVISHVLQPEIKEKYFIRRYCVICVDGSGQMRRAFKRHVSTTSDHLPSMKLFLDHLQKNTTLHSAILVEQVHVF